MLKIAFCSCNHPSLHAQQAGWLALAAQQPDVLLLLGDNIYVEQNVGELIGPLRPVVALGDLAFGRRLHSQYAAQWQVPQFRQAVSASGLVMGTVDDHDFLGNDTYVRPVYERKARLARLLHRQFIQTCNKRPLPLVYPSFEEVLTWDDLGFERGIGLAQSWQSVGQGDPVVKIILLDNRSFRQPPSRQGSEQAVLLGAAQISWLAQELVGSQQWSVVASGSTFSAGDRWGIEGSPLQAYPREAGILRSLYAGQSQGRRVIHVGGDLHYNAYWPWAAAHPFWEFASSGMGSGWQPFARHQRGNFGLISVDVRGVQLRLFGDEEERNVLIQLPASGET